MAYLWYSVHLVVQKPELMSEKMDKMIGWLSANSRAWRDRWHQSAQATQQTQYSTLCVSKEGRQCLSRCAPCVLLLCSCVPRPAHVVCLLCHTHVVGATNAAAACRRVFRPARAQANAHGWRKLELGVPQAPSNFLVLPAPPLLSHPVKTPAVRASSKRDTAVPWMESIHEEGDQPAPSPLLDSGQRTGSLLTRRSSSLSIGTPRTPQMRPPPLGPRLEDSPFSGAALDVITASATGSSAPLRETSSQPAPSLDSLHSVDEFVMFEQPALSRRAQRKKRKLRQRSVGTPQSRSVRRNHTFSGAMPTMQSSDLCVTPTTLGKTLSSQVIPGSCVYHTVRGYAQSHETTPDLEPFSRTSPALQSPTRTRSSPALDLEAGGLTNEPAIRRSSSLHSLRSTAISSALPFLRLACRARYLAAVCFNTVFCSAPWLLVGSQETGCLCRLAAGGRGAGKQSAMTAPRRGTCAVWF